MLAGFTGTSGDNYSKTHDQYSKVLEEKIPEIEKTIAMVDLLTEKKDNQEPLYTDFELNDTLYAKAKIEPSDSVYLWLGVS